MKQHHNKTSDEEAVDLFRNLYLSTKLIGISPRPKSARQSRLSTLTIPNILVLIGSHLYFLHLLASLVYVVLTFRQGYFRLFLNAVLLFRYFTWLVSISHFIFAHHRLFSCLQTIAKFFRPLTSADQSRVSRLGNWLTVFCWLYILVLLFFSVASAILLDPYEYLNENTYGLNKGSVTPVLARTIVGIEMVIYHLCVAMGTFPMLFYVVLVYFLKLKIREFAEHIRKEDGAKAGDREYQSLISFHSHLQAAVKMTDEVYNRIVFLWILDLLIDLMFSVPTVGMKSPFTDGLTAIRFLFDVLTAAFKFLLVCIVASEVENASDDLVFGLHVWVGQAAVTEGWLPSILKNVLLAKFSSTTIALTGWDSFNINRGMILTVVSGLITYTVVLMQILAPST